jgi:3-phenylpropionate/trans-cinnamate dioxygenase ferredoxin subunit
MIRKGEMVRCPWHGWEFDVRTGQSWFDPVQVRVRRYDVTVTPGSELADATIAEGAPPPEPGTTPAEVAAAAGDAGDTDPGMEGMLKGPYVAETYPVTVEQEYIVVEIGR